MDALKTGALEVIVVLEKKKSQKWQTETLFNGGKLKTDLWQRIRHQRFVLILQSNSGYLPMKTDCHLCAQ